MTVQTLAIIVLLVSFFVMIFLRFPIAYAVGLSSVLCMLVQGQALTDVCRPVSYTHLTLPTNSLV